MSSSHYPSITLKYKHLQLKALNASLEVLRKYACSIEDLEWG